MYGKEMENTSDPACQPRIITMTYFEALLMVIRAISVHSTYSDDNRYYGKSDKGDTAEPLPTRNHIISN
jgi:hypothetical protein